MPTDIPRLVEPEHGCQSRSSMLPVSFGSRAGELIQTDVGENNHVDTGLSGHSGQHGYLALDRDGVANFVQSFELGRENTATRQLGH